MARGTEPTDQLPDAEDAGYGLVTVAMTQQTHFAQCGQ